MDARMSDTGTLTVTTPSDREIAMIRVFDAPRRLVFRALTEPDLMKRWFMGPPGWTLDICEVDLRRHAVRLYWKRADGMPYAYLSALPRAPEGEAGRLLFATNAGMFDEALRPVGLYVEHGRELVHASTRSGYGNFHMQPNGIFYIAADSAAVIETGTFLRQRPRADLATQSGPMLVINGRLHPRFNRRSTSLKARTGVGVRADGEIVFAISEGQVSFDTFARLFRDRLNCPNALFLDGGSASNLYAPSLNRHGNILSLGPMLAIFEKTRGASRP